MTRQRVYSHVSQADVASSTRLRGQTAGPQNKGMKLTKPGELRSFAAYPRCSADLAREGRTGPEAKRWFLVYLPLPAAGQ